MKPLKTKMNGIFSAITHADIPKTVKADPKTGRSEQFVIKFKANGDIPFPQVILRSHEGERIFKDNAIKKTDNEFTVSIPQSELPVGNIQVQIEGCKKADWGNSNGDDWVKWFGDIFVEAVQMPTGKKKAR